MKRLRERFPAAMQSGEKSEQEAPPNDKIIEIKNACQGCENKDCFRRSEKTDQTNDQHGDT